MTIEINKNAKINNFCISIGQQADEKEYIKLLGLSDKLLRSANMEFYTTDDSLTIRKNFPVGTITFYKIELYNKDTTNAGRKCIRAESGWARITKLENSKDVFLERLEVKESFTEEVGIKYNRKIKAYKKEDFLVVQTQPVPFKYLFSVKDTVICSHGGGAPELVYLNNGDVLTKINGDVRGYPVSELISQTSNQLELSGKDSSFVSNSLTLKHQRSRPDNVETGTIIYNKRRKCFEGFDGERWRTIKWED